MALITQVLQAPGNIFYQAVNRFQGSWLASAPAFLDTGLTYGQTVSPHMASHTNSIQLFSSLVNAGWITWDAFQLFSAFQTKEISLLSTLRSSSSMTLTHMTHIAGAILSIGAALTVVRSIYHWASSPKEVPQDWRDKIPQEDRQSVSLKFEYPRMKSYSQAIYLTRIVMNVAVAYLSPEKALLCGINAAGLAYSLLKTTQVTWLNFTRFLTFQKPAMSDPVSAFSILSLHLDSKVQCKELTYSYVFPLLPNPIAESLCTICREPNPSTGFSPSSPFDPACLVEYICKNSKKIGEHTNPRYIRHITQDGTVSHYSAQLEIPESDLPSCPTTRNYPTSHYVKAQFTDWNKGLFATTVNVIRGTSTTPSLLSERFLARFGTIYSAFQAGLAALQHRYHELAGKIIAAQKVLCLFDIALLVQNYYQLYCTLYERTVHKMVNLNTPQEELNIAQNQYDTARLNEATLLNNIEAAKLAGGITEQSVWSPTSDLTKNLLDKFNLARAQLAELYNKVEAAKTEGLIIEDETGWLLISKETKQLLLSFDAASVAFNGLKDQLTAARAAGTITVETFWVPKNDETKQLLKKYSRALEELQTTIEQKETALQAQASARVSLEAQYRFKLYIKMGLGIAAVTTLSAISVSLLNRTLAPFNMTELLKKVATPTDFSSMKISSSMPWFSYATECILASRLVVNFALAYFSPARSIYLTTAFLQTFTLVRLAQLPWIEIKRTFIYPNGPMWGKGQKGPQNAIESLRTTFEFLLPSFSTISESKCTSAASHFEASIKAAYDYTTQFFKDSSWSRFFLVTTENGREISSELRYAVTVKQTLLAKCADKLTPFFEQATGWAQDLAYGKSPVHIK